MSYRTLLVHAQAGDRSDDRIRLAVQVSAMFEASIIGLGAEGFSPFIDFNWPEGGAALIEAVREEAKANLSAAQLRFQDLTRDVKAGVKWICGYDYPAAELVRHAGAADLIISSRPPRGSSPAFDPPSTDIALQAGTPLLLAPAGGGTLRAESIVVAWKNSRETRRALADALPFLKRARKVTLVTVSREEQEVEQPGLTEVADRLARHGVEAATRVVARGHEPVAEALERTANGLDADLIVMGAYGVPRFEEWALGGVTEGLMADYGRFVLFSH